MSEKITDIGIGRQTHLRSRIFNKTNAIQCFKKIETTFFAKSDSYFNGQ